MLNNLNPRYIEFIANNAAQDQVTAMVQELVKDEVLPWHCIFHFIPWHLQCSSEIATLRAVCTALQDAIDIEELIFGPRCIRDDESGYSHYPYATKMLCFRKPCAILNPVSCEAFDARPARFPLTVCIGADAFVAKLREEPPEIQITIGIDGGVPFAKCQRRFFERGKMHYFDNEAIDPREQDGELPFFEVVGQQHWDLTQDEARELVSKLGVMLRLHGHVANFWKFKLGRGRAAACRYESERLDEWFSREFAMQCDPTALKRLTVEDSQSKLLMDHTFLLNQRWWMNDNRIKIQRLPGDEFYQNMMLNLKAPWYHSLVASMNSVLQP
eukprot:gnl/MRDRNA2_/MRDRNA2_62961_c0_seq2.p1 gnl/MRDRNA2_/MRDRNA2_62961_c0~~gnl/MRDRNA2_/MRDRNA2_62961_c0_seq2.p1  ORF type:complete len:328 (-),score=47.79 gnl/MRDRNA2_/MRDRNA2_62961_c0_seq2:112-1095(-)